MLNVVVEIPSIKFAYVLGRVDTEEEGWLLVAKELGVGEQLDGFNITFER